LNNFCLRTEQFYDQSVSLLVAYKRCPAKGKRVFLYWQDICFISAGSVFTTGFEISCRIFDHYYYFWTFSKKTMLKKR